MGRSTTYHPPPARDKISFFGGSERKRPSWKLRGGHMDNDTRSQILAELRSRHAARKRADEDVKAARDRLTRGGDIKPEFEF